MAPLSHGLAGLIFPHDSFGDYLDADGKILDMELGKNNFFKAAEMFSEVWSNTVIDRHPVDSVPVPLD